MNAKLKKNLPPLEPHGKVYKRKAKLADNQQL